MVKKFMSRNRSTQLAKQPSSVLSSLEFLMLPVTHFVQQTWVRLCVSSKGKLSACASEGGRERQAGHTGLNLRSLLLVGEELAQLCLVRVVEFVEVGVGEVDGGAHCSGGCVVVLGSRYCGLGEVLRCQDFRCEWKDDVR
jgi:hypothetical protein